MKWINRNDDESNYEDRRGMAPKGKLALGGGIGTIIIIALYLFTGQDFSGVVNSLNSSTGQQITQSTEANEPKENEDLKVFSLGVFNSANEVWTKIFEEQLNKEYRKPTFVTFTNATNTECGGANSATGPFYCPADEKVYIDLSFFHELTNRFKAPGDLAMAYVTAHEVAHHVQKLLGITDKLDQLRSRLSEEEYNKYSVKLELQADFFAGIWVKYAEEMKIIQLEAGDIESALGAANAVGDDTLQKNAQGYVVPDAFTHGTSEQRMHWFLKGYKSGDINQGDTFSSGTL
jgi:predicted metalloprotease